MLVPILPAPQLYPPTKMSDTASDSTHYTFMVRDLGINTMYYMN